MGVTLNDIAKKVGVSPSTVSRVINGSAPISDEMKKKIYKAMNELNYHPNSLARNLATGSSLTIGLVVDADNETAFANSFFNRSVYAIERVAQKNGYNLLITNDIGKKSSPVCDLVYGQRVDGLIIPSSGVKDSLLEVLEKENTPWVMLGEATGTGEDICWVDMDNCEGSKKAVRHLLERGYKKIVYVADDIQATFTKRRIAGYQSALKENGISVTEEQVMVCENDLEKLEKMIAVKIEKEETDAYICSNNILAYRVLQALKDKGKRVPEEIGIITFDNYPMAEYMTPPLTVIDVDTYRLGEMAAELLIRKIKEKGQINRENLIPTELIIRESTNRS
ncbi:MAG: LacI family transcriptional regulator [Blautia sp.]|nr:LacI family transcriptional regulator [Blautia sp.]MDD7728128.1 LacI family DNA-binding transcriptional regulator [Clostridia bacterium]MDY5663007.1 LacI family DNA-binding transcriptional regulator [Blautia sp.]